MTAPALHPAVRALVRVALFLREASPGARTDDVGRALVLATGGLAGLDCGGCVDRATFDVLADALGALAAEVDGGEPGSGTTATGTVVPRSKSARAAAHWRTLAAEVRAAGGA